MGRPHPLVSLLSEFLMPLSICRREAGSLKFVLIRLGDVGSKTFVRPIHRDMFVSLWDNLTSIPIPNAGG